VLGCITGFIGHLGMLYWITYAVSHYGNLPLAVGILATFLLAAYLALYQGLFAWGVLFFSRRGLGIVLCAPLVWVSLEYLQTYLFTGFPWELLGYSQFQWPAIIQVADITGVYGVSFLIVMVNVVIYELVTRRPGGWRHGALALGLCALFLGYGEYRLIQGEKMQRQAPTMEVALVQGNVDQSIKWNPIFQEETLATHLALTERTLSPLTRLVVWPETAVPFFFQEPSRQQERLVEAARKNKIWLLFGSPSYRQGAGGEPLLFNSVYLLSPNGEVAGRFDKVHLVPFGEYVPLRGLFPFMGKLVAGVGDFGTGSAYEPFLIDEYRVGVLICYEVIFPAAARQYVNKGVHMLVNVTNDAWFGCSSAPYQHLSMAVFRAVEGKVPLVRAANTGISAVIDPLGHIHGQTPLFIATTFRTSIPLTKIATIYGQVGDLFSWACMTLVIISLITFRKGGRKHD